EVRLKRFQEIRGADGCPCNRLCALSAFWFGLLYDAASLDAAWDLEKDYSIVESHALRDRVPRSAIQLTYRGGNVLDLAKRCLDNSAAGLQRRARVNANGADERIFLTPLMEFADANETPAERKLSLFHGDWNGNIDPVFQEFAY